MLENIEETLLTDEEVAADYLEKLNAFRAEHIPARYNQVHLLDELMNPEIDHYMSISNRTDGKSFNYIHALLNIAINYDIGLSFFTRNVMLRQSYQELIYEIIEMSTILNKKDFNFVRTFYYVSLNYKDKTIAIISDLNDATELKNFSAYIRNFPIMIYDEFLALESDYLPDEWNRLKTIYESIDRIAEYPLIHKPKIFYFGNAVNFESPILHGLKIFNILERHPINTMQVYHYDFHVALEINRNDQANETRNTRAFGAGDDAMTTAQFETNDYFIASEAEHHHIKLNPRFIYIKLQNDYLKISFNRDDFMIILSIESRIDEDYHYNMQLKDNKENSIYLNESYFDESNIKKIDKGAYLFENNYSKNTITSGINHLDMLKINKILREFLRNDNESLAIEAKEKQFQENYISDTKKALFKKIWG